MRRKFLALVTVLVLGGGLVACGADPEPGVVVNGERLAVVDMHLHTGTWELTPDRFRDRVTERIPRGFKWVGKYLFQSWLSGDGIIGQLDGAGVSAGGLFAVYSPHTTGIATNEMVAEIVARNPGRLFGFASLRVDQWNIDSEKQLAALETALTDLDNMIGIKLANAHQQFRFDDARFYGIYEIAGRLGKPVYLHTATSSNPGTRTEPPYTDPAYLEDAIKRNPDTVFILGHAGWDGYRKKLTYVDVAIDLAVRYPNVYMEPGALGSRRAEEVLPDFIRRIKKAGVAKKLIYGSDGPKIPGYVGRHLEAFVAAMQDADYSTEEMRLVLADNFSRVFGLEPFGPRLAELAPKKT